jgi:hypothetical protein
MIVPACLGCCWKTNERITHAEQSIPKSLYSFSLTLPIMQSHLTSLQSSLLNTLSNLLNSITSTSSLSTVLLSRLNRLASILG